MQINKSQTEKACIVLFPSCTTRQGNTLAVPRDQSHDPLCAVLDKKIHRWPNLDTRAIGSVGQDRTGEISLRDSQSTSEDFFHLYY